MLSKYTDHINYIQSYKYYSNFAEYTGAMITPPPNVTGKLHIGHALNLSIQDSIVRMNLLNAHSISWIPGTDHAGIHTQYLVLQKLGAAAYQMTDEQKLKEIWTWKEVSEQDIINQIKIMDPVMNWEAYKFSLDDDIAQYVTDAFCRLYDMGLIFKDMMISHWDIKLQTVISDLEVINKEQLSKMWYIKYYIENSDQYIEVGTTRTETIFADVAVCVHPDDDRYKHLIGSRVLVPLLNKYVPIIADIRCSIDKGSGAVKIDPPHGALDFDIAKDHNLEIADSMILLNGMMSDHAIEIMPELANIDRIQAREIVGQALESNNYITKIEEIENSMPYGEKSGSILEPMLTPQWFLDISKISQRCIDVLDNDLEIYPESAKNIYIHYLSNPKPWCISRQLIWGHKIPVWYYGDNYEHFVVAHNEEEARVKAGCNDLKQEEGVFDTWFSSTMWPILNTLNTEHSQHLYPTDMLITGRDLIFFWVARMVIMGLALTNQVPFKKVYCHGLVYDKHGQKMSKSKGNVIDPIDLFDKHGVDAVRFALLQHSIPDHDIRFSDKNLDKSQKFMIKIWNAFNYCMQYACDVDDTISEITHPINQWILQKTINIHHKITNDMNDFMIHTASEEIYHFIWNDFCSIYIESTKVLLQSHPAETKACIRRVIQMILKMLNPFAPFITQYFWHEYKFDGHILDSIQPYFTDIKQYLHSDQCQEVESSIDSINLLRSMARAVHNVNPQADLSVCETADADIRGDYRDIVRKLCGNWVRFIDKDAVVNDEQSIHTDSTDNTSVKKQTCIIMPCNMYTLIYKPHTQDEYTEFVSHINKIQSKMQQRLDKLNTDLSNQDFLDKADPGLIASKQSERDEIMNDIRMYNRLDSRR